MTSFVFPSTGWLRRFRDLTRFPRRRIRSFLYERRRIAEYLAGPGEKKLQLGTGHNLQAGWLNTDLNPSSRAVLYLDATRPFPLPNGAFRYLYSEHFIEHVDYAAGLRFLGECHRVLQPGGKARIATPDLQFIVDLYSSTKSETQQNYIRWLTDEFIRPAMPQVEDYADTFVINDFVRDWGHTFIYDEKTLRRSMERAGFRNVTRRNLNDSVDEALRGLENVTRMPPGFLALETLVLEGTRAD